MKAIAIGHFKAHCLALLEEVRSKRASLVITKQGRPLAQVIPLSQSGSNELEDLRKKLRGSILHEGDIVSPADGPWKVDRCPTGYACLGMEVDVSGTIGP